MTPLASCPIATAGLRVRQACLPLALALAAGLGLLMMTMPAQAQSAYQWADENGRKVYSDVPPPPGSRVTNLSQRGGHQRPDTPRRAADGSATAPAERGRTDQADQGQTGQEPRGQMGQADADEAPAHPAAGAAPTVAVRTAAAGAPKAPTVADQEMAFRKRLAEKAEAEQKQVAAAEEDRRQARACDDGKASLRSLESGQRISRTTESGEREFLSDTERESRIRTLRSDLASRC